jgi:hypothetical protein
MTAMRTEELIQRLAADARPVRPLSPPWRRTLVWTAVAVPYLVLIVLAMTPRLDLAAKLGETRFLIEQGAALATAFLAAAAAFSLGVPGLPRWRILLPLPALAVWLGSLGEGCWRAWVQFGAEGLALRPDFICFPAIALAGALPALAMVVMLRRGAPLAPRLAVALGALAAAALGDFGLRLFHPQDASLMVLVWQFGTVAILAMGGGLVGGKILGWRQTGLATP